MEYDKKVLVRISDYALQLIIPTKSLKITQRHQIMCGCIICIHSGTYQDYINHRRNRRLR